MKSYPSLGTNYICKWAQNSRVHLWLKAGLLLLVASAWASSPFTSTNSTLSTPPESSSNKLSSAKLVPPSENPSDALDYGINTRSIETSHEPGEPITESLRRQREMFQLAIETLKNGERERFRQLKSQLTDYVLYPYLERAELLQRLKFDNRHDIQTFLDTYGDTPVTIPVRYRFLHLLAHRNQTALFLTYYRPLGDITLECHWLRFRLKTNENKLGIFADAKRLWLHGNSRPDACDPVFAAMKKSGYLSFDLIWSRLLLALNQKNASMVRYLSSLLPEQQKPLGIYAQNVLRNPKLLARKPDHRLNPKYLSQIAIIVLSKSLWRDPDEGLNLYHKARNHINFSDSQHRQLTKTIALSLATTNHLKAGDWLDKIGTNEQDELLLRWKLAHLLRNRNWAEVKYWLTHTTPPENSNNDWQYWLARAEQELGNHQTANHLFEKLAQKRSYYGFMASAIIGKQPSLQNKQYSFDPSLIRQLSERPGILRAHELWKLNKHLSARREWNQEKQSLTSQQRSHLAAIAYHWGWYDQAIFALSESGLHDSVEMRFPLAFENLMQQAAKEAGIDLTLSLAVARKESAFMPDAYSPVGARGLMQLMPRTARYIAQKEKLPKPNFSDLFDPSVNVTLGTRYLKQLLDEYQGNTVLATASYNAGKHKVLKWLPEQDPLPADIWIETVPYRETRAYIKNVLAYQQIYRTLLGQEHNYFEELVKLSIVKTKP
jgi:soluble lytic murein transglycosylase